VNGQHKNNSDLTQIMCKNRSAITNLKEYILYSDVSVFFITEILCM